MEKNKSKIKLVLLIISLIVIFLLIGTLVTYYIIIPKIVSNIIIKGDDVSYLPPEVNEQLKLMKENFSEINTFLSNNNIDKNQVIDVVSNASNKNITEFISEIQGKGITITTSDQLIDIAMSNFDLNKLDINKLKKAVNENLTNEDLEFIQEKINEIDLSSKAYTLSIPIFKSTIIEMLKTEK